MSFPRKGNVTALSLDQTATGVGSDPDNSGDGVIAWHTNRTYQCWGTTSSGSGSAVVVIEVRDHDEAPWLTIATITLTLGVTATTDGFASSAAWKFTRARVTTLSGTGAKVSSVFNSAPL